MKKLFSFLLIFLTIITMTGCKRIIILKDDAPSITNTNKIGSFVKKMDLEFNNITFKNQLNETLDKIMDAKDYSELDEALYPILNKVTSLFKKYSIADALTNYDPNNSEYKEKYEILRDSYYDYEDFYNKLIVEVGKNDDFITQFFSGYSEEDIKFEIELARKKQDDNYITLRKELDDIEKKADRIGISFSDGSKDDELLELMLEFVSKNKQLAAILGYDSYIEYADINYSRSYLKEDVDDFINYTKTYLVPLMDNNGYFVDAKGIYNTLSTKEKNYFSELFYSSVYDTDYKTINLLNDYAIAMGNSYYSTFRQYTANGNYIYAGNEDSTAGAYSNKYITYFGPGYQDATSVAHEFGHFYSFTNSYINTKSLDLKEFYSQANEYLFTSYLEHNAPKNVENVYNAKGKIEVGDTCRTIVIASALREFEERLYSQTLTDKEDIVDIWNTINNNYYNGVLLPYWKAEIRYDIYYISYGTSATGALGLYSISKDSFKSAKNKYMSAAKNNNIDDDINEVLQKAGLLSPFDEEVFKNIVKLLKEE